MDALLRFKRLVKEIYWAHIFKSSIQGDAWLQNLSLYPGRWAINYSLLYVLTRCLKDASPYTILEFGLGETTKVLYRYQQALQPDARIVTIEHDPKWVEFKRDLPPKNPAAEILLLPLEERSVNGHKTILYQSLMSRLPRDIQKLDLVIIDGPLGSDRYSRSNILELIEGDFLASNFIILFDDYERRGEQDTAKQAEELLRKRGIQVFKGEWEGEKRQLLMTTESFKFLTSI